MINIVGRLVCWRSPTTFAVGASGQHAARRIRSMRRSPPDRDRDRTVGARDSPVDRRDQEEARVGRPAAGRPRPRRTRHAARPVDARRGPTEQFALAFRVVPGVSSRRKLAGLRWLQHAARPLARRRRGRLARHQRGRDAGGLRQRGDHELDLAGPQGWPRRRRTRPGRRRRQHPRPPPPRPLTAVYRQPTSAEPDRRVDPGDGFHP